MEKPTIRINDGENIIDREMTDEEFAQWQIDRLEIEKRIEAEAAAAAAKAAAQAKLTALGLTVDDLKALGL
jgi:hypothetical protein